MGRTGHQRLALGSAAVMVAASGVGVVLSRGEVPVAQAATTLANASHATLVSPAGRATRARDGEQVPRGFVVRTAASGAVDLVTRGRTVMVGPAAAVAVLDGAHQQLRTGTAVIDAQHGPGVRLDIAGDDIAVPSGSAVEATRSVSVVVGALAGPARLSSVNARELALRPLSQVVMSGDALPAATTPLHLTDSRAEARAVPALVEDDQQLTTLAHGINASGGAVSRVVSAAWSAPTTNLPASTPRSDRILPMVIATATAAAGGSAEQRYQRVVAWRRAGGSWGVVVQLLAGHAAAVEAALNTLEQGQPAGRIGTVAVRALAAPVRPAGGGPGNRGGGAHQPPASAPPPPTSSPGGHTGGTPHPSPTPSKGPVQTVVKTVVTVVNGVVGLLPHPKASPTKSSGSGGLLGGLLGH